MNRITLKLMNPVPDVFVEIDGKTVKPVRDREGHFIYEAETANREAELSVSRYPEVCCRFYLLWHILFFIISIFGIFDRHSGKRNDIMRYRAFVETDGDVNVTARINTGGRGDDRAVFLETDAGVDETENRRITDPSVRKRRRILIIMNVIIVLSAAALTAGLIAAGL